MPEFIQIGYTQKTHGVEGELRIFLEEEFEEDFLNADALFLEANGSKIPFFIEYIRGANADIVKLEDIKSKEEAMQWTSKPVFLRESDLIPETDRENTGYIAQFEHLEGFEAWDKEKGLLGTITRIDEYPHQEMAVIIYKGREALIPLQEPLLQSIDEAARVVRFQLPEGLLDL